MKKDCKRCSNFKKNTCELEKKNTDKKCQYYKMESMETLKKEYYKLLLSGEDKERKNYLENIITEFNGGTI